MPKRSWATDRFVKRDGMRHCLEQGCTATFELTTSTDGLKKHFQKQHKEAAVKLGLLPVPIFAAAFSAAAAAGAAAAASSQDSVVDMVLDDDESAAATPSLRPSPNSGSKRSIGDNSSSAVSAAQVPAAKRQLTLKSALAGSNNAALIPAVALCFASNHIAYNVASSPTFIAMCKVLRSSTCAVPQRKAVKAGVSALAASVKEKVLLQLSNKSSAPVTIAIDGWTNVRQTKVTNVVLLCSGVAYYWCSISNSYAANTARPSGSSSSSHQCCRSWWQRGCGSLRWWQTTKQSMMRCGIFCAGRSHSSFASAALLTRFS